VEWITIFAKETQKLGHAKIQKPLEDHSEGAKAYQEILEKHNLWKSQCNNLITYIYTCRLIGANETEFIMSCPSDVNRDGVIEGRIEIGDPPFTPYYRDEETKTFLWSPGMERGFSGLTSLDERMESTLYGGDLITCTAPLFDDNGEVEAIISIDFDIEQWEQMASVMQYKSANTLINTCACLLFVTSFLVLSLRYLRSLAEANTVLARTLEEVKKAQTASHAKSSFLANMSHEIRTPMNAILGFASILLRSELKPIDRENVFEIRRASQNLLAVINDILDIAKIESGKIMTIPVQYGLSSLVNDVVGTIGVRFVQKPAVHFFVEVDPQIPSTLIGDEPRIRQGILNFLSNAVKFTDKGFVRLTIGGRYSNERFILHIAVQDTGRGIKEEDIDKLFHAFEQVDTHRNRQLEGTGLGLAITRHIIEMVGGTIAVETKYDKGSTFSCELPQNIVAGEVEPLVPAGLLTGHEVLVYEPDDLEAKNWRIALQSLHVPFHVETQWSALQSVIKTQTFTHYFFDESTAIKLQDSPHVDASLIILILNMGEQMKDELSQSPFIRHPISSLSIASALLQADNSDFAEAALSGNDKNREKFIAPSAKILVVDDNDTNLRLAIGLLEPYQCQVQCVTSGKEAIALLKMKPVDIVFMDHMMPEMDGIETVQIIRKFDTLTPIIALTANVVAGVQETYYNEGFSDFFPKPIEISNLEHILKTWLPNHKIEAQKPKSSMGSGIRKGAVNIVPKPQCTAELNVQLGIQYSGGNSKLHRQVCDSVLKDADKNLDTMIKAIADKDWHRFTVEVHAVKSSSMSIGAVTLSEFAKQLEALGNESNETAITANWQEFLHLYSVTMQKIQEYLNEQQ
jgi:signal transduction histidine kinase/CheY-like chemotaxis protein